MREYMRKREIEICIIIIIAIDLYPCIWLTDNTAKNRCQMIPL